VRLRVIVQWRMNYSPDTLQSRGSGEREGGAGAVDLNRSVTSNQAAQLFLEESARGERSEVESHATGSGQLVLRSRDPPTPSLFSWLRPNERAPL